MNQVMEELENERWARLPAVTNNDTLHSVGFLFLAMIGRLSLKNAILCVAKPENSQNLKEKIMVLLAVWFLLFSLSLS